MKRKEFLSEIKKMSPKDLKEKRRSMAEELLKLRFRKASGQLEQAHRISILKRELARVETALSGGMK